MKKASIQANLPVSILREGKRYVAYTPALDLSTSGKSLKEVKERFSEAVDIFFEEVIKNDTLDEVLHNLGWEKVRAQWVPPTIVSQESQIVRVPALNK